VTVQQPTEQLLAKCDWRPQRRVVAGLPTASQVKMQQVRYLAGDKMVRWAE
jgi:hypothetical protein